MLNQIITLGCHCIPQRERGNSILNKNGTTTFLFSDLWNIFNFLLDILLKFRK